MPHLPPIGFGYAHAPQEIWMKDRKLPLVPTICRYSDLTFRTDVLASRHLIPRPYYILFPTILYTLNSNHIIYSKLRPFTAQLMGRTRHVRTASLSLRTLTTTAITWTCTLIIAKTHRIPFVDVTSKLFSPLL